MIKSEQRPLTVLAKVGELARKDAMRAGIPIHYLDPENYGRDIIREYPDGRRERLVHNVGAVPIPSR